MNNHTPLHALSAYTSAGICVPGGSRSCIMWPNPRHKKRSASHVYATLSLASLSLSARPASL